MSDDRRPDPDALLLANQPSQRGQLRLFFGYAAGVGKTYAMLESAHRACKDGRDCIIGYIEPHARPETQQLTVGLEALPTKSLTYRNVVLQEFDVDAALRRHPEIILVDELAHSNAEGSRHLKRWQDVEELLAAGIDVWSTLNVQHIESLNDVVGKITGVVVRETIPDKIFHAADELELVDLPPDDLIARLSAGKIYISEQARRAINSFFQKSNLNALRELSLRQTAQRIHFDVETGRRQRQSLATWATSERLLVCLGPSPTNARVIRTAKRMAQALDAPWHAVSVEVPGEALSPNERTQLNEHFRLAESLGAQTATLSGSRIVPTILEYARSSNVTKLVIGKTRESWLRQMFTRSLVDRMIAESRDIDVYVIHGEPESTVPLTAPRKVSERRARDFVVSSIVVAGTAILASLLRQLQLADAEANTVMLLLASVSWIAFRYGREPAIYSSILAVVVFDFFFVPPRLSFRVSDAQYLVTLAVMLAISLAISTLASRLRIQVEDARQREHRTSALYQLGKQLSSISGHLFLINAAAQKIEELMASEVVVYTRNDQGLPNLAFGDHRAMADHPLSISVADWVIKHDQIAGTGTDTLPNAPGVFFPITGSQQSLGAIGISVNESTSLLEPARRQMIEACANQLALALERDQLAIDAIGLKVKAEAEQVRSILLSSVSHDLKTPLATIAGASSSMINAPGMSDETKQRLLESISSEASRLNRLLENILQMSRLEAGAIEPNMDWHVIEEVIGHSIRATYESCKAHKVVTQIAANLPLWYMDASLIEQVLINLLDNAARYTAASSTISIGAQQSEDSLIIKVADEGLGIDPAVQDKIFERFYRANPGDSGRGSGLGLAICRAITGIHGGTISVQNRPTGGAEFTVMLPMQKQPPHIDTA